MSSPQTTPPSALAVGLALASVYLVWGSTYLAIRVGLEGYPPFLMGSLRLSGRSSIPLLSSYSCAIPGIMASRTIASPRDRVVAKVGVFHPS